MQTVREERFVVRSFEVDSTGRAHVASVANYLQEAAARHAMELGVARGQLAPNLTWMLVRLAVEMDRWPIWRDEIRVETWPSAREKLHALRDFVLHADDSVLGVATSAWVLVDVDRRRPVRLVEQVRAIEPPARARALEDPRDKVPDLADIAHEASFAVRWSECDVNLHANQSAYVGWAVDVLPAETLRGRSLQSLVVDYRAEARLGETVVSQWGEADGGFRHRLAAADGRELARLKTTWRARRSPARS